MQGEGLGELLLLDALSKCLAGTENIAAVGVIVDAINDDAVRFYERYDFQQFMGLRYTSGRPESLRCACRAISLNLKPKTK